MARWDAWQAEPRTYWVSQRRKLPKARPTQRPSSQRRRRAARSRWHSQSTGQRALSAAWPNWLSSNARWRPTARRPNTTW
eukprot:5185718-Prymnesium_polylepis.1